MKLKMLWIFVLTLGMLSFSFGNEYKIGVLAKNGPVKALNQWGATADYLNSKVSGHTFTIVPLAFDDVFPAIQNNTVDFFLVNSSMYATAKVKYKAKAIATMINSRQGQALNSFGGVIITDAYNDDINSLKDIKGKSFMAVKASSFGGWQMAYKEFLNAGINPFKDFVTVEFGESHDNVVLAVMNGAVSAGTIRTDTMERMAANDLIDMEDFKVLNKKNHSGFPFVCSTALYPEWPFAKTQKTPAGIAKSVSDALKALAKTENAAQKAKIIGWKDAQNYSGVESLQKSLKIGAYK